MARESYYQKRIIDWFKSIGGTAITGTLPTGEADIQAGYPYELTMADGSNRQFLLNVMVEVKTEEDYHRVMRGVVEKDGRYFITDSKALKKHEPLQILKLNNVRSKGGLALIAFSVAQVIEYIEEELL